MSEKAVAVVSKGLAPAAKSAAKRVIVIGAGMAGLTTGYELTRAGHDVQILEARDRPGGRIHTWRGFTNGLYAEGGAAYIGEGHRLTRQYASELGMALRPVALEDPQALLHLSGRTMTHADAANHPEAIPVTLTGAEKGKSLGKLWREATHSVRAVLEREGDTAGWDTIAATYAKLTLHEFLELAGWSDTAIHLFATGSQREIRLEGSAVGELRELIGHARATTMEIIGGMDQLPRLMYARLADRVRFGSRVIAVQTSRDHVAVTWATASGQTAATTADYAVLTVPVPVALGMHFHPNLSRAKVRAMRAVHYGPAVTVAAQFANRFWEDQPYALTSGGTTCTDLPSRRITYPTYAPDGTVRGVLRLVHAWQPDTSVWTAMDPRARVQQFAADLTAIHQASQVYLEFGFSHDWTADPYSGGNVAMLPQTDQQATIAALAATEARLLFAGEHTTAWHGTVEGAVASGVRAASEIHHAPF